MASNIEKIRKQREMLLAESSQTAALHKKELPENDKEFPKRESRYYLLSGEAKFYGIADLVDMLGWSRYTVLKLFGDPAFPAVNFGKRKVVESHALIEYFSRRRSRNEESYWCSNA